jgi:hypothetical protein
MGSGFLPRSKSFQTRTVDQKDVEPAIVIVVIEGDAAAGRVQKLFILVLAAQNSFGVQAGFFGHIHETDAEVGRSLGCGFFLYLAHYRARTPWQREREHPFKWKDERGTAQRL